MPNGTFKTLSLSTYHGKWVVLFFYPVDFTFVCLTEIWAFSDAFAAFKEANVKLLACSTDSEYAHLAWTNIERAKGGLGGALNFPILADKKAAIARAYGVLKADEGIAYRGVFLIDLKGPLRQFTVNDNPVGRSVDEVLRLVKAFQFVENRGEVCPANWQPGEQAMKPNAKDAVEGYFSKLPPPPETTPGKKEKDAKKEAEAPVEEEKEMNKI